MRYICRNVIFVLLSALASCTGGRTPSTNLNNSSLFVPTICRLQIKVGLPKRVFRAGEDITARLEMEFDGGLLYLEFRDYFYDYFPHLFGPNGKEVELSARGQQFVDAHSAGASQSKIVRSHYDDRFDFPLSSLFDFSTPGIYKVVFERPICPKLQDFEGGPYFPQPSFVGTIRSNEVCFEVENK